MDRRTAAAASLSLLATVAVGGLAFAALGGVDVLGFGSQPDSTVAVPRRTVAPVTTAAPPASTLPAGVPKDWPVGVPIPPKPPGCVDGQLEDNGVWNCQH